jgi:deoxycytidylate deaminase
MTFAFEEDRLWNWAVGMAKHVATLSKDPSTKVGAVIFDDKKRLVSAGYNGLPRGVLDSEARLTNRETQVQDDLACRGQRSELCDSSSRGLDPVLHPPLLHTVRGAVDTARGQACLLANTGSCVLQPVGVRHGPLG